MRRIPRGIVVITTLQPIAVVFTLPQQDLPAVAAAMAEGAPEVLALPQGGDRRRGIDRGTLTVLDNQVDPTTGTIKLKATFPNERPAALAGRVRHCAAAGGRRGTAPTWCRRRRCSAGRTGRMSMSSATTRTATRRTVTVGHEDCKRSRSSTERADSRASSVVVDGASRLTDGAKVSIAQPPARGARRSAPVTGNREPPQRRRADVNISAPFIARPIATSLLAVAVLLAGLLGYRALPVSALPQVDFPTIEVTTQLPGASPDTVATLVTAPLERQFGQIQGLTDDDLDQFRGHQPDHAAIRARSRNIDSAAQDVQAAINAAGGDAAAEPALSADLREGEPGRRADPDARADVRRGARSTASSDAADTLLQPQLAQIAGVGQVTVQGNMRPAVRVRVDPARLAALRAVDGGRAHARSPRPTSTAPRAASTAPRQALALGANDQLVSRRRLSRRSCIAWRNGAPVRLCRCRQRRRRAGERPRAAPGISGKPAVVLDIQRQPGANIVQTVDRDASAALPELQRAHAGRRSQLHRRQPTAPQTIRACVADVQFTLLLSVVLVVLVDLPVPALAGARRSSRRWRCRCR